MAHQPPQQQQHGVQARLQTTLRQLHTAAGAQRQTAEQQLLAWRQSPDAWSQCLQVLQHGRGGAAGPHNDVQVLLFAAQTLKGKIAAEGAAQLSAAQQEQLQAAIVQLLVPAAGGGGAAAPAGGQAAALPPLVVRQLCLALACLAALLPSLGGAWLLTLLERLQACDGAALVRALAEEGASDWRHVLMPGVSGGRKLSMATATRERFRCALADALPVILTWLQQAALPQPQPQHNQQQQQQVAAVQLLETLAAVVRLGTLHHVSEQLAEQAALAGLTCVQSAQPDVVHASEALLGDVCEFGPEALLARLRPHMLAVAGAAITAATSAAAAIGQPAQDLMMHAAAWSKVFAAFAEAALPDGVFGAADGSDAEATSTAELRTALLQLAGLTQMHAGRLVSVPCLHACAVLLSADAPASPRRASTKAAADAAAAAAAAAGDAASEDDAGPDASSPRVARLQVCPPAALVGMCQQLLLTTAACVVALGGAPSGSSQEAAVSDCPAETAADAITDVFAAASAAMGPHAFIAGVLCVWRGSPQEAAACWLQQPHTTAPLPPLRLQQLQHAMATILAAPAAHRLHLAVSMAAAAQGMDVDAAPGSSSSSSSSPLSDAQLAASVAELLSADAAAGNPHTAGALPFCRAVTVWSGWLVCHFASMTEASAAATSLHALLQLLLSVGPAGTPAAGVATAAVRAVLSAAAEHTLPVEAAAPLLLQAVQALTSKDEREQDLLASLALTLAAPCAPQQQQQQQQLRLALVQPAVDFMTGLLQQLQAAPQAQWSAALKLAEPQLSFHLARVRTVLDALLLQQEQQAATAAAAADDDRAGPDGNSALAAAEALSQCRVTGSGHGGGSSSNCGMQQEAQQQHAVLADPAIALILQLLSIMGAIVLQHHGWGKVLGHYAKCSSRLLKLEPDLLLATAAQQAALLEVLAAGATRPGGSSLCEPLAAVLEHCFAQPAGSTQLQQQLGPLLVQGLAQVWSQPAAAALAQPGAGDANPDQAAALLRLGSALTRHAGQLQATMGPSSSAVVAQCLCSAVLPAAAGCARCCHRRVGRAALALLLDVLVAATNGMAPAPQQQQQVLECSAHGALGALLVPSPLPRLTKVVAVLMELATLAQKLTDPARRAAAPGSQQQTAQQLLQACLALAAQRLPVACTVDAPALASVLAGAVSSSSGRNDGSSAAASRSYAVARKLKRRLREFAEQHARSA